MGPVNVAAAKSWSRDKLAARASTSAASTAKEPRRDRRRVASWCTSHHWRGAVRCRRSCASVQMREAQAVARVTTPPSCSPARTLDRSGPVTNPRTPRSAGIATIHAFMTTQPVMSIGAPSASTYARLTSRDVAAMWSVSAGSAQSLAPDAPPRQVCAVGVTPVAVENGTYAHGCGHDRRRDYWPLSLAQRQIHAPSRCVTARLLRRRA